MKVWKSRVFILGICILLFSTVNVIAEEDPTGDIYHQIVTENGLSWDLYSGEKSYIDITDISYSITDSQAILTMTVADDIVHNEYVYYYMHLRSDENSFYQALYSDENGIITGVGDFAGFYNILDNPTTGNTFTATFDVTDPYLEYTAWGWTGEFIDFSNQGGEGWLDYAPGTFATWYNSNEGGETPEGGGNNGGGDNTGNTEGSGTPGFELVILIAAIGVAFILLKRKK